MLLSAAPASPVKQGPVLLLGVPRLFLEVLGVNRRLFLPPLVGLDHFFQRSSFARVKAGAPVALAVLVGGFAPGLRDARKYLSNAAC